LPATGGLKRGAGGAGSEDRRIKELTAALDIGAPYIDLELGTPAVEKIVKEVKGRAQVIVSYHNLKDTPPVDRLRQVIINQLAAGAIFVK